jgi:hypothetical protein
MRQMFVMSLNEPACEYSIPESYCAPSEGELLKARRWVERGGGWAGWSTLDLHTTAHCFYLAKDKNARNKRLALTSQQGNCTPLM